MNVFQAEEPNDINNRIHDKRPQLSNDSQLAIPAIQAQRAVSMSAQGNALGWASHADQSPKGAALFNWDRTCIENRNRAFRAAPLGLKNPSGNRVPRPMAWADIGLARWAEMQSHATRTNSRPAGTQRREHHDVP